WQILRKMGAKTEVLPSKLKMQYRTLQSIQVDMQNMPDQVPTLAVAALFAKGKTIISQIQHLRYKESDRIGNLITELKKLGAEINYKNNKLIITPLSEKPPTTVLNAHNDHRLFMSFYVISKLWPQIEVQNANCVKKSFPNFLKEVEKITNYLAFTQIKKDLFH
ncbi:MAG TPA: 3-phosphoshikimate 1-carboxyvinyltransferase, partial [Candidatus Cloacimonas sp.]|nr:3-phosphoshikimate 1-carboxyvinyltransferase [Candidatus Cloacimonas sp.]